ncbi:hypothetical protein IJI55_01745 [Candidatus Saccharibacteria bacterium]|nr:hypothetical protein [Candidatus Saccharibacteria bacterium]
MKIIDKQIDKATLANSEYLYNGGMIKGVVDVKKELLAIDGEMHADLEQLMLEQGSNQYDLWGINLYFDDDDDDFIEFDSMINIRPSQGNCSRSVEDSETQAKIKEIVTKWIK